MSAGTDSSARSPSPAVRLSPRKTMRGRPAGRAPAAGLASTADAGGAGATCAGGAPVVAPDGEHVAPASASRATSMYGVVLMCSNANMLYGPIVNTFDRSPGATSESLDQAFGRLAQSRFVERL